jgi:hypothetical protein
MLFILFLLAIICLLSVLCLVLYFRYLENAKLDKMALNNMLTDEEKRHFIAECKKIITAQLVYELMAEKKYPVEVAREVVREMRDEKGK